MARTRQRVPSGTYKPCRGRGGCGGRGWIGRTATGRKIPHARCGGDGWIKVGTRPAGRKASGGGRLVKVADTAAAGAVAELVAGLLFGVAGMVVVGVLVALVAALAVHRAVAGALR